LQVVLAGEVGIERRTADICRRADVVDGDGVVALLWDERNECLLQECLAAGNPSIHRLLRHFFITISGQNRRDVRFRTFRHFRALKDSGHRVCYRTSSSFWRSTGRWMEA